MQGRDIVTRFAPSPTGFLHLGGLRTALYNYLFARKHGGRFLLRIEDTDARRTLPGAEDYIMRCLTHFGLTPDNQLTPEYRQSDRYRSGGEALREVARRLVEAGVAYWAYDAPHELDAKRSVRGWAYNADTRDGMDNDLSASRTGSTEHRVLRFKTPTQGTVWFDDVVRGRVSFACRDLDDKVLIKSDGTPTYHLANVLDDRDMAVTHVIRGEEWLPSTPLHVMLYDAMGYDRPVYAHLPLILSPAGGKLSKRNGAKQGIDVFPLPCTYVEGDVTHTNSGYVDYQPQAVLNYLALLGWAPSVGPDVLDLTRMVELFELADVNKAGMAFDLQKLRAINAKHVRALPDEALLAYLAQADVRLDPDPRKTRWLLDRARERSVFLSDVYDAVSSIVSTPTGYSRPEHLDGDAMAYVDAMCDTSSFDSPESVGAGLRQYAGRSADMMRCLRQVLTGGRPGPELDGIMWYLGRSVVSDRLRAAMAVVR